MKKSDILPAAELLEKTAEAFESGKIEWVQKDYGVDRPTWGLPTACLLGGLGQVAGIFTTSLCGVMAMGVETGTLFSRYAAGREDAEALRTFGVARKAAAEAIKDLADGRNASRTHLSIVVNWNDHDDTTLDEVVDVLKHAAKNLRNQAPAT